MNFLKKYRHTLAIPAYGILYLLAFQYVEQRSVRHHIIHMKIDDYIPFCEYFIVPYFLWFIFIAATVFYFAFINKNKKEYWQLVLSLGIGMTLFIIISLIFPNGQELRPSLSGDSIFIEMVRYLYKIDTPTNIFPSIHVFNTVACCIAVFRHRGFRFKKTCSHSRRHSGNTDRFIHHIPETAYTAGCSWRCCFKCFLLSASL